MYSGDIKRRNPVGQLQQGVPTQEQSDEFHAFDPYAPNPLKPAFQQQQHQQYVNYSREHPSHRNTSIWREYSSNKYIRFYQQNDYILIPAVLTLLSFWTRFRDIKAADYVVWDEAHFGKFGSYYIKGDFYFDVHPPLGKMLVGLSGALAGYNGSFPFESGATYPDINYGFMRIFNAFFGAIMVPFAYFTAQELKMSRTACVFAAVLVLCDNAYLTISRFILLDSMLLAATCFYTIEELWDLFGDLSMPKTTYLKHWVARAACLIALPFAVYVASFAAHFAILRNSGTGDAQMSSLFQAGLRGNQFSSNPLEVAFGSKVTIKNTGYGGGLLHSHVQTYPEGSGQQQVTCYHHKDSNNNWIIKRPYGGSLDFDDIQILHNGDSVRLVHESTGRNLHSHRVKSPITTSQWEVSCYGGDDISDPNDEWVVEVVDEQSSLPRNGIVRSLSTTFRLRHKMLGCLLTAENTNLPQWGFRQVETFCDQRNRTSSAYSIWNVEQHWNDKLPPGGDNVYKPRFWKDFWHLNVAMMTSNNALIPDPDKEDVLASNPSQWPLLAVGLRMCGWGDDKVKYYLLGNPLGWWFSTLSIGVFMGTLGFYVIRRQRKFQDISPGEWENFQYVGKTLVGGWILHYLPFCIMGRVTYLHHYFPALYFTLLLLSFTLDHFLNRPRVNARVRTIVWSVLFTSIVATFLFFWDVSYGIRGPAAPQMNKRQWRAAWNIIDDHKPNTFI